MAVHRFEMYLERIVKDSTRDAELPPLDVALVWHSYLLNPRWYREDTIRLHPELDKLNNILLDRFADSLDPISFQPIKNSSQSTRWQSLTNTPFDPLEALAIAEGRTIRCPLTLEPVFTPFVTRFGYGYAQQDFKITGPSDSGFVITHEVLGISRLVDDLQAAAEYSNKYMASTLFATGEWSSTLSQNRAERVKLVLFHERGPLREPDRVKLGRKLGWARQEARAVFEKQLRWSVSPGLTIMLGAYSRGEPFSLDLAAAVLRQGTFVQKMHDLGWTQPGRFNGDEILLQRSVARYHAFLDLISSSPSTFCVPSLDIDLAWHSHQLNSSKYRDDTINLVGRFVDHDDKVEENALSTAYDVTARAWQARFNVPYSICGCPLPDEAKRPKLSRLLRPKPKPTFASGALLGVSSCDEDADATHPSSHNSIFIVNYQGSQAARELREQKRRERIERDERLARKGKFDEKVLSRSRNKDHERAFLYPVPLFVGAYGYPIADESGCAATGGGIVGGDHCRPGYEEPCGGACAVGAGTCGGNGAASCRTTRSTESGGCASGGCGAISGPGGGAGSYSGAGPGLPANGCGGGGNGCGGSGGCSSGAGGSACSSGGGGGGCSSGGGGCGGGGGGGCGGGGS